jgi:hypothetical protein
MRTGQLSEVMVAIATLVPKKMTLKELAVKLHCTVERLEAIKLGVDLTIEESKAFAKECGGVPPFDYRPFVLQEDTWWQQQSTEIQAKVQYLVDQANYSFQKSLSNFSIYNKQLALFALMIVMLAITHGVWLQHKYQRLRPEANHDFARLYAHRQITWAQTGIEVASMEIIKVKRYSDLINQSKLGPAKRAAAQRVLLYLARYYKECALNYMQIKKLTELTLNNPKRWNGSNVLLDPFTYQYVDVEGDQLDQEKIKELIHLQLSVKHNQDVLDGLIDGKVK